MNILSSIFPEPSYTPIPDPNFWYSSAPPVDLVSSAVLPLLDVSIASDVEPFSLAVNVSFPALFEISYCFPKSVASNASLNAFPTVSALALSPAVPFVARVFPFAVNVPAALS